MAAEAGLQLKWKKCQFLCKSINFLGHIIENGEIRPSLEKTAAIQKFTELKTVKEFLGMTGSFRKFIKDYAIIARPLTNLLRKEMTFKFGIEERKAVEILKMKVSSDPVLKI